MEQIKFELNDVMTMPNMIKKGYRREDITKLFEVLEEKGFGTYTRGKRGRGNPATFNKNPSCPNEFVIEATRKRYKTKTDVESTPKKSSTESEYKTKKAQALNAMWELSKNIVLDPTSTKVGYDCEVLSNQILTLHRIRGGGEDTIEKAVMKVWGEIKPRIGCSLTEVISRLKGNSFFILKPNE